MNLSEEELATVAEASHAVVREAKKAGVWVFGGGILSQQASIVAVEGSVSAGPYPEIKAVLGGFAIVEVAAREEALQWAAKIASSCRCAQEVREIIFDPDS
ncbi:YciI family protein [Pseudomarimonas arenosa]|nr:YciI family protein [Pseudomarimonas arenosa]